ncbi:hypothetical protein D9M72_564460 [compost metagenome]
MIAEITIDTETATANCWNSCPLNPGMKATGTKTESRTRVMATIAPVISRMARRAASGACMPGFSSITRSMFSTTTIASSTTMPIASTIAKSETVFSEKPIARMTAKVPISATGTATSGISVALTLPRNRKTTMMTSTKASSSVCTTFSTLASTNWVVS